MCWGRRISGWRAPTPEVSRARGRGMNVARTGHRATVGIDMLAAWKGCMPVVDKRKRSASCSLDAEEDKRARWSFLEGRRGAPRPSSTRLELLRLRFMILLVVLLSSCVLAVVGWLGGAKGSVSVKSKVKRHVAESMQRVMRKREALGLHGPPTRPTRWLGGVSARAGHGSLARKQGHPKRKIGSGRAAHALVLRPLAMFVARGGEGNEGLAEGLRDTTTTHTGRAVEWTRWLSKRPKTYLDKGNPKKKQHKQQGGRRGAPWGAVDVSWH